MLYIDNLPLEFLHLMLPVSLVLLLGQPRLSFRIFYELLQENPNELYFILVILVATPDMFPRSPVSVSVCNVQFLSSKFLKYIELTLWKRLWCWEGLGAGREGDDRGWVGWRALPTRWTWVWVNSGSWWWTGRPGVLRSTGSPRVGHNWVTELNWNIIWIFLSSIWFSLILPLLFSPCIDFFLSRIFLCLLNFKISL